MIDTPGFRASDNLAAHLAAQKVALESVNPSGVYVVVEFDRADVIAEAVDKISDPRNCYKACPFCGEVFVKTEGCNGETICGELPAAEKVKHPAGLESVFVREDADWRVKYNLNGSEVALATALSRIRDSRYIEQHQPRSGSAGCGARIVWSQMRPLDPSRLSALENVELLALGAGEMRAKVSFHESLVAHVESNVASFTAWLVGE